MSDPSECATSIAAMVKDWYASPHKSDIPATLIDRRMARFEPSPALSALAMRERAADAYCKGDWDWFSDADDAIRALPTTFTDAELLAAAMQLPEVQALIESATPFSQAVIRNGIPVAGSIGRTDVTNIRAAIAPFRK